MKNIFIAVAILGILISCSGDKKPNQQAILDSLEKMDTPEPAISDEVIGDIIQQIPAPLEISVLIKQSGTKYDKSMLNDTENVSNYNSNYQKALNLGIYGMDLGYTNIYEQNQDALFYLNAVNELATGLSIGQFFDIQTIKRLATNSSNLDSLLFITTKNFNDINEYLQSQRRSNLSVLLLTGGWLEALHVLCQVQMQNPDMEEVKTTIGEQKIILENIMLLLSFYIEADPNIAGLHADLTPLQEAFNNIEIIITQGETTTEVVDGVLMVIDNSTSEIKITEENLQEIREITDRVRNKIIS